MELIINRVKYKCTFNDVNIIISPDSNELAYSFQWNHFIENFEDDNELIKWAEKNQINDKSHISYEFTKNTAAEYLEIPLISNLFWRYTWFIIGKSLIAQDCIVDFKPKGLSLSCYKRIDEYDDNWDLYERIDFNLNYNDYRQSGEATFNFGISESTDFEKWGDGIRFLDDWTYFDEPIKKLGLMRFFGRFNWVRKAQWIVHYRLE